MKLISSKENLPTNVYTEKNPFAYKYSEDLKSKENRTYYDVFLVNTKALISSGDFCVITHPHDSEEYVERCDRTSLDDGREVFYGEKGTRCLLSDVAKIIDANKEFIEEENINKLNTDTIIKFLAEKPLMWF